MSYASPNGTLLRAPLPFGRILVRRPRRRGTTALEVVMITAVGVSMAAVLYYLVVNACDAVYRIVAVLVGWPLL